MFSTHRVARDLAIVLSPLVFLVSAVANPAKAERPPAASLLPEKTVAFVSVADSNDLSKRFMKTALGRMSQQERMKPLIERLYTELQQAAAALEGQLGITLADVLAIPQGEMSVALVAPKDAPPAVVGFLDAKEQIVAVELLLEKADAAMRKNGATPREEKIGNTMMVTYKFPGTAQRQVMYFEREGTLVVGTNPNVMREVLRAWDGDRKGTLALNRKYSTIMKRCRQKGEDPQITWFVDPLELVRSLTQNNDVVQIAMTLLEETLGLGGLKGVGGSITFATEKFDNISHMHVLLDNPRDGIVEVFALGSGDVAPEKWVPRDVVSYTTIHWHLKTTIQEVANVLDTFGGEGFTTSRVQRVFDPLGIDFQKEILPVLDNRFTYVNWVKKPVTDASSQMQMLGVRLKDPEKAKPLFEKVMAKFQNRWEKDAYSGKTYYRFPPQRPDPKNGPPRPRPCVAMLGEYLLLCDRPDMMKYAIKTSIEDSRGLATAPDFQLIADQAKAQAGRAKPAMISFNRPEEGMKFLYDLITGQQVRGRLRRAAAQNPLLDRINKALDDNPLPPFEALKPFLAPAGAVMIDEATGIHYISFGLKPTKQ